MEQIKVQRRQHELIKTLCRVTGKSQEQLLDQVLLEWAARLAKEPAKEPVKVPTSEPVQLFVDASPLLHSSATVKPGPAKIFIMQPRVPVAERSSVLSNR